MPRKPKHNAPMKRVQMYITDFQHAQLAYLSGDMELAIADHFRRAIDAYFELPHIRARLRRMPKDFSVGSGPADGE